MSDEEASTSSSGPAMWAKLIRIDPPKSAEKGEKEEKLIEAKYTMKNDEYHHVVTSYDFPDGDIFPLYADTFSIGRAKSCNLTIRYNKLVSGTHCEIRREADNNVYLVDMSTNGTLVNKTLKLIKKQHKLHNGDTIHLVHKNDQIMENVGFHIQFVGDMEEVEETVQYTTQLDQTLNDEIELPEEKTLRKRGASPSLEEPAAKRKAEGGAEEEDTDEMGETLVCIICQDIFHDCISLQPCMHSFCAGCYSEWMATSDECPCCRLKVDRMSKNHLVNNLVESYLKKNPMKKRSESDLKELDAKNKITHDMLYKQRTSNSGSSQSSFSSQSSTGSQPAPGGCGNPGFINYNAHFARVIPTFGPPRTQCRQCPQNNPNPAPQAGGCAATFGAAANPINVDATPPATTGAASNPINVDAPPAAAAPADPAPGAANSADPTPGTSAQKDEKSTPQAPNFVCAPMQNHILCMCCLQPMPDRRIDRQRDPTIPNQQCGLCYRFFCHSYWTCPKADCLGCLGKFREMNFGRKCLTSILLDNTFESNILKDYLDTHDLSVRQMLETCVTRMEAGEYTTTDSNRGALRPDTNICYPCGLRNFKELVYKYRCDIAADDLPALVRNREDCYWGKGCRTQKHKPHHAAKFNHICDATRTGAT